jgi:hypothetical protein
MDAIDATVDRISETPLSFALIEKDVRRARVSRFPYCLYFRVVGDVAQILAVHHHSRSESHWRNRR